MSRLDLQDLLTLPKTTATKTFTSKIQMKSKALSICSKSKSINWEICTNFPLSSNPNQCKIPSTNSRKHFHKLRSSQIPSQFQNAKSPKKTSSTFVNSSCLISVSKCTRKRLSWKIHKSRKEPTRTQVCFES